MGTTEIIKKGAVGLSKAILIALHHTAITFTPGSIREHLRAAEEFEDKVLAFREPTREQLKNSLQYLRRKKLVEIQQQYQQDVFTLTKLGRKRVKKLLRSFGIAKPAKWDGKWRMVIFDIPETKKEKRDVFRQCLKNWGFANVQGSIWIHPYECRDQIFYLAGNMFIKPYVRYVVAEQITGEADLQQRFGLD